MHNGKLLVDELLDIKSIIVYLFKSVKWLGDGILIKETERLKVVVFLIAISVTLSMLLYVEFFHCRYSVIHVIYLRMT